MGRLCRIARSRSGRKGPERTRRGRRARGRARGHPPPPAFPDQCRQHQDDYNDAPCRGCKHRRESNEAAAQAAAANDPVQQLTQRYFDFLEKRHRRDPNMPPPNWDRCLDWAGELVEHPWCGQCDEFQRTVRNEYGGPVPCQCRPGRRHGVAS